MHSLLLRVMAERSVSAFNKLYHFPHLQVFADRNRVEKEETFEIPSAARDRFLMEVLVEIPADPGLQRDLMVDTRFHDVTALIAQTETAILPYTELNAIAAAIQEEIQTTRTLEHYGLELCRATHNPTAYGIIIDGVNIDQLIQAGISPRGMSMLLRTAKVRAWLQGRPTVVPEDLHAVFHETVAHRVFFSPVYELRRSQVAAELMGQILNRIAAP